MGIIGGIVMKWEELAITEFNNQLGSKKPTPGGGTASAIALSNAASLAKMVCELTLGSEKWRTGWNHADSVKSMSQDILNRSYEFARFDSEAFDKVMDSFRLPKGTEEEIEARRKSIRQATLRAAQIPFDTACLALELLKVLPPLITDGNKNAVSDVGVASLLASAACKGALFNVEINLSGIPEEMGIDIRTQVPAIKDDCSKISRNIMDMVKANL